MVKTVNDSRRTERAGGRPVMSALALIRLLRPVLPGARLQQHLTDCAAYEVLVRPFEPELPPLTKRHVLGLRPPPLARRHSAVVIHPDFNRVHAAVTADGLAGETE